MVMETMAASVFGAEDDCEECQCFVKELCWLHATTVPDAAVVPLAVASLPDVLYFVHNIQRGNSVYAKRALRPHTVFGPLIAHGHTSSPALKLENDYCCNWMKFVSVVGQWEEPNLRLLRRDDELVFVTVKVILPGEELKLAVQPRYMPKLDSSPCKPTRLADVHLEIRQDSLSHAETEREVLDVSAPNMQNIAVDDVVNENTVCVSDAVQTILPIETDPPPHLTLPITVKSELPLDREGSPEYSFPSLLTGVVARLPPNVPRVPKERQDTWMGPSMEERADAPTERCPFHASLAGDAGTGCNYLPEEEVVPITPGRGKRGDMNRIEECAVDADCRSSTSGIPSDYGETVTLQLPNDAEMPPPLVPVTLDRTPLPPPLPVMALTKPVRPLPGVPTVHSCHLCPRSFSTKYSLQRHARDHDGTKYTECLKCSKLITKSHKADHDKICNKKRI